MDEVETNNDRSINRILPFAVFMGFIALEEGVREAISKGYLHLDSSVLLYLYPFKVLVVGFILITLRSKYSEVKLSDIYEWKTSILSVVTGVLVFVLWINMDWHFAVFGNPEGFNVSLVSDNFTRCLLVVVRIIGASVIVPIMEEIFWRSWFIRYMISADYRSIPVGAYTLSSFIISSAMFGLEHNLWLAGVMAGIIYNVILYRTKSIVQCIFAHAVTNFALGVYVLQTGRWSFW